MRWMMVLVVAAALGVGFGLGSLSKPDSGGVAGRAERTREELPAAEPPVAVRPPEERAPDVSVADLPVGDGIITGSVVDSQGAPIGGVLVVAQPRRDTTPRKVSKAPAGPDEREIAELVQEWASAEQWRRSASKRATTDEDGQFALTGLGDVGYSVAAYRKGLLIKSRDPRQGYDVRAPAEVHFVASAVVRVPVEVLMEDGSVPQAAQITLMTDMPGGGRTGTSDTWTAAEPWIEVVPGSYGVYASPWGTHPMKPKEVPLVVSADETPETLRLTIIVKPTLRLSVVPPAGFEAGIVQPRILRVHGERVPELEELQQAYEITAWPAGAGAFEFRELDPGRYLVGVGSVNGSPITASKVVEVPAAGATAALHVPAPDPRTHFMLRPVGPDGKPAVGLSWFVELKSERRSSSRGGGQALRREDGVYFVPVPAEHNEPDAKHFVTAQSQEWGSIRAAVKYDSDEIAPVAFEEPGFVEATIAKYVGSGREGRLTLALVPVGDSARQFWSSRSAQLDEQGRQRLGPVQPGDYELQLSVTASRRSSSPILKQPVTVRSGTQKATVPIPALHELTITWSGEGRPRISLSPVDPANRHQSFQATVGADGTAVFRDLPPGEYEVRAPGPRLPGPRMTVSIPETSALSLP